MMIMTLDSKYNNAKNVTVFGDSILKGTVYDEEAGIYRNNKENSVKLVSDALGIPIDNQSKFGITSSQMLERMKKYLESHHVDIMVVEVGGNDANYPWDQIANNNTIDYDSVVSLKTFESNITEMIALIRSYNIKPLMLSLPPINAQRYFNFISQKVDGEKVKSWLGDVETIYRHQEMFNAALTQIVLKEDVDLLDIRSELLSIRDLTPYMCIDGLHYNEKGQILISEIVKTALNEII